jgi:hypothetical protein
VEHPTEFHAVHGVFEPVDVARHPDQRRVVALGARQFEQLRAVLQPRVEIGERADDRFELLSFLAQLLRPLRVVPDPGILERPRDSGKALRIDLEVKDTSADRQRAAAIRRGYWRAD